PYRTSVGRSAYWCWRVNEPASLFEVRDGERGDGLLGPDHTQAIVRGRLDGHPVDGDAERAGDRLAHGLHLRCEPRRLRDDRRVQRSDPQSALADEDTNPAQQLQAARSRIRGVVAREVPTEITEIRGAEERVHEGVQQDVAVGVAHEPLRVLDRDTAEHEPAIGRETMDIVPDADPHRTAVTGKPARPLATSSRA